MPQPQPSQIVVRFDALGWETQQVQSYSLDSAYMTSTDSFSLSLYDPDITKLQDLELQPVSIFLNGNLHLIGRVEQSEIGRDSGTVTLQGRDYLADMIECNVDPALSVSASATLDKVVQQAALPVGISSVSFDAAPWRNMRLGVAVNTALGERTFKRAQLKQYKPNPGEGIYQFLSRLCTRSGCTIQPTTTRNAVVLSAPDYVQDVAYSVSRSRANPESAQNNVISAVAKRDYSKFPSVVIVSGQASQTNAKTRTPVSVSSDTGPKEPGIIPTIYRWFVDEAAPKTQTTSTVATKTAAFSDNRDENIAETILALLPYRYSVGENTGIVTTRIAPTTDFKPFPGLFYRLMYLRDQLGKDTSQIANTAARLAADRLKDCLQYEIVFRGHTDPATGRTYASDTIIDVADDLCAVNERLWVNTVRFSYDAGRGAMTQLTCWRPGSFGIGATQ